MQVVELEARHVRVAAAAEGDAREATFAPTRTTSSRGASSPMGVPGTERACRATTSPAKPSTSRSICSSAPISRNNSTPIVPTSCKPFVSRSGCSPRRLPKTTAASSATPRAALELAVLDAFGRAFGEPLTRVTELVAPELYKFAPEVRYSGVIGNPRGWKKRLYPLVYRLAGFKQVKLKVGIEGQDDVERTKTIRGWLGRKMDLRIDANEAWAPSTVAARVRELEPFGITSVEQPVRHEDVMCLADVRKQVRTPVMLDESLCGKIDAERAVKGGWCDLFNLRLSKCGGFIPSVRLAQLAKRHNLGYQLGCQVGETAILSAAGRHFATSVSDIRYLEGSYDRHLVWESLSVEDLTFRARRARSRLHRHRVGLRSTRPASIG